ncbi:MAG: DHHW family protein [Eubacteriales bacterium]
MLKNKRSSIITLLIAVAALIILSFMATLIKGNILKKEQIAIQIDTVSYGQDGKADGQPLDEAPIKITGEYVYFQDRIVKRFYFDDHEMDEYSQVVYEILADIPKNIEKTFMLVPSRIVYEDSLDIDDKSNFIKTFEEINGHLGRVSQVLNVYEVLKEHTSEYIYFRTDETWTATGAYYAAKEYLAVNGVDIYPLDSYKENRFIGYVGTMWAVEGGEYIFDSPDYVSYYTREGMNNNQTITANENGDYIEYDSPALAVSRMGTDIFLGGIFSHSIIAGDEENSKSLMIIGDKNAKLFAIWMIPYYEKICVLDPAYFDGEHEDLEYLVSSNDITELIVMTSMNTLDNQVRMDRIVNLMGFSEQNKTEEE